ncbi:MAG: fumarate hydratase C-terminal domain-containing protein [Anaerolineae bacterium]|nr:fumarate hydratase C-terminal domain-containing protein [Anaerolineae bacterium]
MSARVVRLRPPLDVADVSDLHAGDQVRIQGPVYVARDAAHKRLVAAIAAGEPLPFDPVGQVLYYMGPSPARPGRPIGAAGPTTSYRMDPYTEALLQAGIKAVIGKGERGAAVRRALRTYRAVYLVAVGGAGALLAQTIRQARVIAYPELGPEAVRELYVEDFPAIVGCDVHGQDIYELGRARYRTAGDTAP